MRRIERPRARHRMTLAVVALAAAAGVVPVSSAVASTGAVPGSARANAVQAVLDRVVGPGNSIVEIADTVQTSATTTSAVTWGTATAAQAAWSSTVVPGGGTHAAEQQNLVGGTRTSTVTPAGGLVRQSVSVAVDRRALGSTSITGLKRLVSAAAGVVASRGDRISVLVATFPARVPAAIPQPFSIWAVLAGNPVPAGLSVLGVLLLLAAVARRALGGRTRTLNGSQRAIAS